MRKHEKPEQKQRRHLLQEISYIAAALYWLARLILLLWDRFAG